MLMKNIITASILGVTLLLAGCGSSQIELYEMEKEIEKNQDEKKKKDVAKESLVTSPTEEAYRKALASKDLPDEYFDRYLGTWYSKKNPALYIIVEETKGKEDVAVYDVIFYQDDQVTIKEEFAFQPNGVGIAALWTGEKELYVHFGNDTKTKETIIGVYESGNMDGAEDYYSEK
jgi:hypothetical protein